MKTIIFRLLVISVLNIHCGMAQQNNLNSKIKNESQLRLVQDSATMSTDIIGTTYCSGSVDTCANFLEEIGITKTKLAKKVRCTVGDFDGNGYLDFAFWGIDKSGEPDYENYVILFFDKAKTVRCLKIKTPSRNLLVYYSPRQKVGPHGEPKSINDGLWLLGETNGYDDDTKGIVYIFNLKTNKFDAINFGKK